MSHKVPEDGGVDAEGYAKEPLRSATSSISRERASGFYVRCILANMRVRKRAQRLAMLHRFPIISRLIDLVSRCEIMRSVWVRREILRAIAEDNNGGP